MSSKPTPSSSPKSRTPKQAAAARANGAKSKGPKTPQGKKISSQNAITHGITAKSVVIDGEELDVWQAFHDSFVALHKPANQAEYELVLQMVQARWRIRRAYGHDAGILETQSVLQQVLLTLPRTAQAFEASKLPGLFFEAAKALRNSELYVSGLERSYQRALKDLETLRSNPLLTPAGDPPRCPPAIDDRPEPDHEPVPREPQNEPEPQVRETLSPIHVYIKGALRQTASNAAPRRILHCAPGLDIG